MISNWMRVIHSDNGTLTDLTLAAQNSDTLAIPLVAATDYLYIGQHYPFNNVFFDVNTANTNAAIWDIEVWTGSAFTNVADILDETAQSGVPWSRSGVIQFSPSDNSTWKLADDTSEDLVTGISTLTIYNMYWMRMTPSASLSAGTIINRLGYRFANTQQLNSIDPDLSQYLTSWESGKTDWDEQIQLGSQYVIADMKSRGIILHPGQALRIDEISLPTAYRTLALIYSMLGPDFEFRRAHAVETYKELMSVQRFTIDKNSDGVESFDEVQGFVSARMVR